MRPNARKGTIEHNTMTAQQAIDNAITGGKTRINSYTNPWLADDIYLSLKDSLVKGTGCMFVHGGFSLWMNCDHEGNEFLYARELPILG